MAHHDVTVLFREVSDFYFSSSQMGSHYILIIINIIQNIWNLFSAI